MKHPPLMALVLSAAVVAAPTIAPTIANAAAKPSIAENQTSAVGEIWLGYSFLSPDNITPDDESYPDIGGNLRVNIPAGAMLNLQLDLMSETGFVSDSTENYTGSVLGGAHFSWRDPNEWLAGAFVGVGNGFNANDETVTAWLLGVEGQYYLTDWTLYGQLGYMDADEVDAGTPDAFRNAWFGRGVGRYFLDGNVKLEGELSFASGDQDTNAGDMDVWGWGLRYERAMRDWDASVFVAYQGNYYESNADAVADKLTEHVIKLGLSVAFGIQGQKYVDRQGATLDLPMVTRWSAYGVDVVD